MWKTQDERGTTWQGWTPKPGQEPVKTSKTSRNKGGASPKPADSFLPQRKPQPNLAASKSKVTGSGETRKLPVKKQQVPASRPENSQKPTPAKSSASPVAAPRPQPPSKISSGKDSRQPDENKRWSNLYSVFSNPVNETSGFWEDAPAGKSEGQPSGKQATSATKSPVSSGESPNSEAAAKRQTESTVANPSNTPIKKTGSTSDFNVQTDKKAQGSEKSKPIPRTPEETLDQEKQRLLAMIKKAEALLDSSQDAIASFEAPQDKA